jgi:glycosyltransferase involved in cell wall biosynthesis
MRTLDVLYVGTLPPHQGGSAVTGVQLLTGLERRRHVVRAIAPITAAAAGDGADKYTGLTDVRRYRVSHFETSPDVAPARDYQQAEFDQIEALFEEAVATRRPDVVVVGRESFAVTVSELASRRDIPRLQRVAGATMAGILHGTYDADAAARVLDGIRTSEAVVAPARHMAAALEELGISPVHVVRNPVDLTVFAPGPASSELRRSLGIDAEAVVVAHVSNLKPLKRAHDLVTAAQLIGDAVPSLELLVLGSGHEQKRLRRSVADLGLRRRFHFVDWVDHDLVPAHLNLADIVVMPSAAEAQARVYLETQACGRVLVATDIPAAREVVEDGETGLLFPVGDAARLAEIITRLARDDRLRSEIGRRAARHAAAHDLTETISGYEQLLANLSPLASSAAASRPAR